MSRASDVLKKLNEEEGKKIPTPPHRDAYGAKGKKKSEEKNEDHPNEEAATQLIGDMGTKGAVQALIDALEGFKEMNKDAASDDPELEGWEEENADIDHDIKILKGTLSQFKHRR